jgi:hypothetical protein
MTGTNLTSKANLALLFCPDTYNNFHIQRMSSEKNISAEAIKAFTSTDIADLLVGITPIYLNSFLQRKLYGITASISDRHGEKRIRIFDEDDVRGIALVWMLFEAGLRTQPIRRILNELAGTKKAVARTTAEILFRSRVEYIVVVREPRRPRAKGDPQVKITTAKKSDLPGLIAENPTANVLVVPIGAKLNDIRIRVQVLYGE